MYCHHKGKDRVVHKDTKGYYCVVDGKRKRIPSDQVHSGAKPRASRRKSRRHKPGRPRGSGSLRGRRCKYGVKKSGPRKGYCKSRRESLRGPGRPRKPGRPKGSKTKKSHHKPHKSSKGKGSKKK